MDSFSIQREAPHNNLTILRIFKRTQNDDWSLNRLTRGIKEGLLIDFLCGALEVKTIDDIKKLRNLMKNLLKIRY